MSGTGTPPENQRSPYVQYLDPWQQMMLAYGGGGPTAQPQAQIDPRPGASRDAMAYGGLPSSQGDKTHGARDWGNVGSWAGMAAGLAVPGIGGFAVGPLGNVIGNSFDLARGNRAIDEANQTWGTSIPGMGAGALGRGVLNDTLLGGIFGWGRDPTQAARDAIQEAKSALVGPNAVPAAQGIWNGIFGEAFGSSKDYAGFGGDVGGSSAASGDGGGKADPGKGSDAWGGGTGGTSGWYAKGGKVRPPRPGAKDPPGPDDQMAGLQTGEGVINRPAMQGGWGELLSMINSDKGGALASLLKGLLGGHAAAPAAPVAAPKGYWRGGQVQDPRATPSWDPATGQKIEDSGLYVDPQTGLMVDENGNVYEPRPERPEWSQPRPAKLTPGRR